MILAESRARFADLRKTAEGALAQVSDDEFFALPEPSGETNSIALIVKHIAGNARSRWTDFMTSDGEKADRVRDTEFERFDGDSRVALMAAWARGWDLLDAALAPLTDGDLERTITIRGEPHTVPKAIIRGLDHLAYHVGQILYLSRLVHSGEWRYVTLPPRR